MAEAGRGMTGAISDIEAFRRLVLERSGLSLGADKDYLLQSRLTPLMREEGLATLEALFVRLRLDPRGRLAQRAVDAMATHESYFFRDATPFDQLRDILLPALVARRTGAKRLRIWSAACSSGQEPYSLAMLLLEERRLTPDWSIEILATDMSQPILDRARRGIYSDFETARGLSEARRSRWLKRDGGDWSIAPEVRALVQFRPHNLMDGVVGMGRFDLIFCRNVLIYFEQLQKRWALARLSEALEPDGALILGSAETVVGLDSAFEPMPGLRGAFQPRAREDRLSA
ncbi:MAG: protein-glutamate O-methyltransferase CheR [Caulobacteraceae bacterium]|nr:protein-glutamate O-methyltransferase CheR [Caulobacteraceae bacterium]